MFPTYLSSSRHLSMKAQSILQNAKMPTTLPPPKYKCLEDDEESLDPVFFLRNPDPSANKRIRLQRIYTLLSTVLVLSMFGTLALMFFKAENSLENSISRTHNLFERIRGLIGALRKESKQCDLPQDPGPCRALNSMYYFDRSSGSCKEFIYGGCNGNSNRFKSKDLCIATCAQETPQDKGIVPEACKPKPEAGPCRALMNRYYFDSDKLICTSFNYGGCNGNSNNFESKEECEKICEHPNPRIVQVDPPEF